MNKKRKKKQNKNKYIKNKKNKKKKKKQQNKKDALPHMHDFQQHCLLQMFLMDVAITHWVSRIS